MFFTNTNDGYPKRKDSLLYLSAHSFDNDEPHISSLTRSTTIGFNSAWLVDYQFKFPNDYSFANVKPPQEDEKRKMNQRRLEYLTRNTETAKGKSNDPSLQVGQIITMKSEVLVSFINGDIDRPVIMGSHYNQTQCRR